jgi:hypothetical protein
VSVVPTALPSSSKGSVSILGHRVSTDALLLAGASVVAIIVLYLRGRPGGAAAAQLPVNMAGDGSTFTAPLPSNGMISSAPPAPTLPPFGHVTGDIGGGYILSAPNPAAAPLGFFSGSPLAVLGPPVIGATYGGSTSPGLVGVASSEYIPVAYAGGTGYIWAPEARVT